MSVTSDSCAFVVANIVLADGTDAGRRETIRTEVLGRRKDSLAAYKMPAVIRFVERLGVTAVGKLARAEA
jgi:acyl-coenzyme A synthetase/AMP-(fatty) acid ligase